MPSIVRTDHPSVSPTSVTWFVKLSSNAAPCTIGRIPAS